MSSVRTADDYKNAIRALLSDAEEEVGEAVSARDVKNEAKISDDDMDQYLKGLDLLITEEATVALRAEFLRYSSVFDTDRSRETIRQAVNMAAIAKEVISEAIEQISQVRKSTSDTHST